MSIDARLLAGASPVCTAVSSCIGESQDGRLVVPTDTHDRVGLPTWQAAQRRSKLIGGRRPADLTATPHQCPLEVRQDDSARVNLLSSSGNCVIADPRS